MSVYTAVGDPDDATLIIGKWESLALAPCDDLDYPNDYFLFTAVSRPFVVVRLISQTDVLFRPTMISSAHHGSRTGSQLLGISILIISSWFSGLLSPRFHQVALRSASELLVYIKIQLFLNCHMINDSNPVLTACTKPESTVFRR